MIPACLSAIEPEWTVFPDATFEPGLPPAMNLPPPENIGPRLSAERRPIREKFEQPAEVARRHFTRMAEASQIQPVAKSAGTGDQEGE